MWKQIFSKDQTNIDAGTKMQGQKEKRNIHMFSTFYKTNLSKFGTNIPTQIFSLHKQTSVNPVPTKCIPSMESISQHSAEYAEKLLPRTRNKRNSRNLKSYFKYGKFTIKLLKIPKISEMQKPAKIEEKGTKKD